jgi:hypothetical protein
LTTLSPLRRKDISEIETSVSEEFRDELIEVELLLVEEIV